MKKSFEYYAKAIELEPNESACYHNFGTTVFLFPQGREKSFTPSPNNRCSTRR